MSDIKDCECFIEFHPKGKKEILLTLRTASYIDTTDFFWKISRKRLNEIIETFRGLDGIFVKNISAGRAFRKDGVCYLFDCDDVVQLRDILNLDG